MSYDRSQVQQTGEYTHGYGRPTHFASAMPAIVEATEPDLDKIERGEEVQPRATGDERLILLMNSWEQRDETWIAKTFDAAGDDAIQSFLERHIADIEPNKARRLTEYLRKMEGWSEAFQESLRGEADAPYASTHLAEMLKKKVVPVIREVLGASRRVKASRGGKDPVPGPHNERQVSEAKEQKRRTEHHIEELIRQMPAYGQSIDAANELHYSHTPQAELKLYDAQKRLIERRIWEWKEANKQTRTDAYRDIITRLHEELYKTKNAGDRAMGEIYGAGAVKQEVIRQAQVSRSPSQLRLRGGMRGVSSGTETDTDTEVPAKRKRSRSSAYESETEVPAKRKRSESEARSASAASEGELPEDFEYFFAGRSPNDPGYLVVPQRTDDPDDYGWAVLGAKAGYSAKARDVADLYTSFFQQIEPQNTYEFVMKILTTEAGVKLNKLLPEPLLRQLESGELGKDAKNYAQAFRSYPVEMVLRMQLAGTLQKPAKAIGKTLKTEELLTGKFTSKSKNAWLSRLLGKGNPTEQKSIALDKLHNLSYRMDYVAPSGMIFQLYDAYRTSLAGSRSKYKDIHPLQLIQYTKPGKEMVPAYPEFKETMEGLPAGLGTDRHKLKIITSLFGVLHDRKAFTFSKEFWTKIEDNQFIEVMKKRNNYKNWVRILIEGFELDEKEVLQGKAITELDKDDKRRIWGLIAKQYKPFIVDLNEGDTGDDVVYGQRLSQYY